MDLQEQIQVGINHHVAGDLVAAEQCYREVLLRDPEHPDAHHLLANIRHTEGKRREALNLVNIAISKVRDPIYLNTRGMILIGMQLYDEAQNDLRAALKLKPDYPDAHNNLAVAQQNTGQIAKALANARKAVELNPGFAIGWGTVGSVLFTQGELQAAKDTCELALKLNADLLSVEANLAKIEYMLGNAEQAKLMFSKLEANGLFLPDICYPHALLMIQAGQVHEAAELIKLLYAKNTEWSDLAKTIEQEAFFSVLQQVCSYLGEVLGDRSTALDVYAKTVAHVPNMGHAIWTNMGKISFDMHQIDQGIAYTQKAVEAKLTSPAAKAMAYNNLGVFYMAKHESVSAIENFKHALEAQPGHVLALGWLLKEKAHICDWDGFDQLRQQVDAIRFTDNRSAIAPFTPLAVYNDPQALKYWASMSAHEIFDATARQAAPISLPIERKPGKFRLGYYSFDFRNHPVAYLTARLFELHNRDEFEIYAYSYGPDDGSEIRKQIKSSADAFVDLKDLSVVDTAKRIGEDDIDFLIDLTGNTLHNRCQSLALRPARRQAHWLGFIGTMGSSFYDYIIADDIVAPFDSQDGFVEKILQLPAGFHIADDGRVVKTSSETRQSLGLPEQGIVFGCFAQTFKIQPEHFDLWMQILKSVPGSVLWMANGPKGAHENLCKEMLARGVDSERLVIAQRCDREQYLSRFQLMDVHLDTFPYTSGTVASDALFSGCPLLTLSGKTMVSRMAQSILFHAGMPELVASDQEEYVKKAISLAQDNALRLKVRATLLQKRDNHNLLSTKLVVDCLEQEVKRVLR